MVEYKVTVFTANLGGTATFNNVVIKLVGTDGKSESLRAFEDTHHLGKYSREQELKQREEDYRWDVYLEGISHNIKAEDPLSLPCEVRFSFTEIRVFVHCSHRVRSTNSEI
ncbi:hypothetical protein PAMA_016470 [Pampus argenteus]